MGANRWAALLVLAGVCGAADRTFEIIGHTVPEAQGFVSLHGATTPFSTSKLTSSSGQFRFTKIAAGQYTLAIFSPGYGEKRSTLDVGPSTAGAKGRYEVTVRLDEDTNVAAGHAVSAVELSIPDSARKEYAAAQKKLGNREVEGAIVRLERAVEIAPRFSAAWNNLGTIAYQTRRYSEAESYFRKSLEADPAAYEPLVNLGGVLLTLGKAEEAYHFNLYAVLKRPTDALANSQLGMNYFALGKPDLAEKYLVEARRLDPAHFSHPQLLLAEIYLRRGDTGKAADALDEFLRYHPGAVNADQLRAGAAKLRGL